MPVVMVVGAGPVPGLGLYEASEDEFRALFADRRLVFAEDVAAGDLPAETPTADGSGDGQGAAQEGSGLAALGLWARPVAAGGPVTVDGMLLHGFAARRRAVEAMWREGSAGVPSWAAPARPPRRPVPAEGRRSLVPVVLIWVLVLAVAAWWYAHRG